MTGQPPKIDLENMPAPAEGILVTDFLIVRNVARSRAFYADVLGGQADTLRSHGADVVVSDLADLLARP